MSNPDKTLNPKDYPSDKDADDLVDRGDGGAAEEEEAEEEELEEEEEDKKPAKKKAAKKKDDDSEEEEEEDDDSEEEEEEPEEKAKSVPLHVLRKSQQKRRDAENRAKELEAKLKDLEGEKSDRQKQKFDKLTERMDSLYEEIENARAEGRTRDAAKLQKELDEHRADMTRAEAAWHATKQALAQQSLVAFNALVSELEAIDPRFDETDDEFDEDLVDRVGELTEAYEAKGLNAPEALRKALRVILGNDPFREVKKLAREQPKQEAEKRKTDVRKNLAAAKKQPPEDAGKTRERSGKINPLTLSDDDWEKLPESTRKKLRGDFVES